jgi:DNA-binding NarL/FixJ family response regulator
VQNTSGHGGHRARLTVAVPADMAKAKQASRVMMADDHVIFCHGLSDREKQVVLLVAEGRRNKEIGEVLSISEQTVKNHLRNIFDKLGVSDRLELALYAIHQRLIEHT